STAARCLVYVRRGSGSDRLLDEVRRRVPSDLQEQIDRRNLEVLRARIEKVADDFGMCIQKLTSFKAPRETSDDPEPEPNAALKKAAWVRAEGGMGIARMFLLKSCWRAHIPWLPQELCPTAQPPDFRMHY
ncbi:unnamed protein product, partial [Polarella glacialis]